MSFAIEAIAVVVVAAMLLFIYAFTAAARSHGSADASRVLNWRVPAGPLG